MDAVMRQLGFAVCHQLPERTLFFGSRGLPVCARDTGLLVALFLGLAVLCLPRRRSVALPPAGIWLAAAALLAFFAFDAVTAYAGWRETTNTMRLLSGMAGGAALAVPLSLLFNRHAARTAAASPRPARAYAAYGLGLAAVAWFFLARPAWGFQAAQWLVAVSLVGAFAMLNLVIVASLRRTPAGAARLLPLALALVAVEMAAANRLHAWFV